MASSSWNFEDEFATTTTSSKTQHIHDASSSSSSNFGEGNNDSDSFKVNLLTQRISEVEQSQIFEEEEKASSQIVFESQPSEVGYEGKALTRMVAESQQSRTESEESPILRSKRKFQQDQPSPVFISQSLISSKNSKISRRSLDFEIATGSQIIESGSTQKSFNEKMMKSQVSNRISSVASLSPGPGPATVDQAINQDTEIEDDSFFENLEESPKRRRNFKKGGLADQLNQALKQLESDRVLSKHLPSQLVKDASQIMKAQIMKIQKAFSAVVVTCRNCKMDTHVKEFDLLLEKSSEDCCQCVQETDLVIQGPWKSFQNVCRQCLQGADLVIQGPWSSFKDADGRNVICNVMCIEIIPRS